MPWAFTTVSATVNTTSTAGANATSTATVTVTGNFGISNALFADNSIGGSVGANTLGLRQSSGTTTAPTTPPVAGATFVNGTIVHTITGYTAGTRTITFNPVLTVAIANNASITLNPAIQVGAQVVASDAVYSVTAVSSVTNSVVTLFPQTGVTVPSITSGTSLTFYNPLLQSGTDTTIGTALAGLASFRSDTINAFADTSVGGGNGAVTLKLRRSSGSALAPFIDPTPTTTFLNSTLVHRVTSYNSTTGVITFSPPLNAAITDNSAVTLFTPGVTLNRGDGATGLDSYTVNSTRVRITGTFTQNAWAEQLVMASNCPATPSGGNTSTTAQLVIAASTNTVTLNGLRVAGWGQGSGSVCPTAIFVFNIQGNASDANCCFAYGSGTLSLNNATIQHASHVELSNSSVSYTNATFINNPGSGPSNGELIYFSGASSISGITFIGTRTSIFGLLDGQVLSGLVLDGATGFTTGLVNGSTIYLNLSIRNVTTSFVLRTVNFPLGTSQSISRNHLIGSNLGVAIFSDGANGQGGHLLVQKQVAHSIKNLAGTAIDAAKVFLADTQNLQRFNWFSDAIDRAGYTSSGVTTPQTFAAIAIKNSTTLTNLWNGDAQRTYTWASNVSGVAASQNIVLAYVSNPNRRGNQINCVSNGVANLGSATINVDNGTTGLFANLTNDIGAPQINGYFVWAGTRHIITSVTVNASDYTLGISPSLTTQVPDNTALPIQNIWYDVRNKSRVTATIDHPSAGTYAIGASQIVVDNGAGALLATTPVPYTNFIHAGEIYLITAVSSSSTEHTLTISPSLRASIADNATITLENIPGSDFFDFYVCSYPHLLQQQELNLTGTGTLTNNWTLLADPLIVQTNIATARNTTPTLASHVYDGLKAWLYDNFAGQTAVLVNRNGSILDAFAYNVVFNNSAANNYSFASNTITLKTNTFTDTLTTTGIITLSQPGTYSSGIVPSGGKLVIAANGTYNLTGWTFANGSTIEDTATGTVNLSLNYEATAITNNSSGITLSNTGGGTLNVTYKTNTLSAPNFAADTKAYGASIISGTETQLFSTTLASAGLTQGSIELLTGTQVRVKAAYWSNASGSWVAGNFLDTTLSWSAQSGSSVASQIGAGNPDPSITQANRTTVEGYTSITTAAQLYDRAKLHLYNNYTATNFTSAPLVTRSGTTLNAGSYNLTLATSGSVFALSSNTITINAPTFTDTLTTTGTITLNNPSTTAINYASGSVPAGGTVALATAGTYDLSGWTFASGSTISNTSGGAVTVWLYPTQVGNASGTGANLTIVAKPQPLLAPNLADGTRAYAARVQIFSIAASVAINTSTHPTDPNKITLGLDLQGKAADFAPAAPWTQVRFSLQPGATLPSTTGNVLKDGGFYYWSNNKLYTSIANIPGTPVDFLTTGSGSFTIQAETELFNAVISGSTGLSQSLIQPDGIQIRLKATRWAVDGSGNASATQFLDTRDSLITWSAFTGATVSTTLELEAVHEQIVATSYVQSGKYGQLFPAKRGDQFGSKFTIALEGVGTLQINADDDTSNPAGVELLQDIFLWWCWVRSTEAGIRLASYDTLTAINFTTYQAGRVEVENTDASVPLIIAGGSISFAGSSNGIAATSNAIYLNVDVLGVVAITGVAAADIRSAVGLGSANLDSQLGDITALVL